MGEVTASANDGRVSIFNLGAQILRDLAMPSPSPKACIVIPSIPSWTSGSSTEPRLLILDGHVPARRALVLAPNEIRDLLILGLLDRALVALISSAHELFLHEVDTYKHV